MPRTIYAGQRIGVEGTFRLAGVPTDPAVVSCLIRPPGGGLQTLVYPDQSLTRDEPGVYLATVVLDTPGTWSFRWEGAGTVDAIDEIKVPVETSSVI